MLVAARLGEGERLTRVTVVNDNPDFLELMRDILEDERYVVTTIDGDRADALDLITASQPDILVIDLRNGEFKLHGWDVAQQVRAAPDLDGLPVLICSADPTALRALEAQLAGQQRVATVTKPFALDEVTDKITQLLGGPTLRALDHATG